MTSIRLDGSLHADRWHLTRPKRRSLWRAPVASVFSTLALAGLTRGQAPSWVRCPLNDHWYALTTAMPWAQAEQQAVAWGGHLATIRSSAENVWISSQPTLYQTRFWIGLYTTANCGGTYQWISAEPVSFAAWGTSQPDCNFNTDCSGAWDWERWGEVIAGWPVGNNWNNMAGGCPFRGLVEVASFDCDGNGLPDRYEIANGLVPDCNANGAPDSCDVLSSLLDCDANGQVDTCELASGTGLDANANGVLDACEFVGFPFCFGDGLDPSHASTCPCVNNGAPGHGCANSSDPAGALLTSSGSTAWDAVVLHGSQMPASSLCLYLQGDALQDATFGDGVICTGGSLIRIRLKVNVAGASQYPDPGDPSLSTRGLVRPGSGARRYYQTYYRNPASAFCPPATFNISSGQVIDW